jgi:hypothetical protein
MHVRGNDDELEDFFLAVLSPGNGREMDGSAFGSISGERVGYYFCGNEKEELRIQAIEFGQRDSIVLLKVHRYSTHQLHYSQCEVPTWR